MRKIQVVALLAVLGAWTASTATAQEWQSGDSLVQTPSGWFPKACVHEVPSGATLQGSAATVDGAVAATFGDCGYPAPTIAPFGQSQGGSGGADGGTGGWAENSTFSYGSSGYVGISVYFKVPNTPSANSQTFYMFDALSTNSDIIQPILAFNGGQTGAPSNTWYIMSYYLGVLQGQTSWGIYYSTPVTVSAGDTIDAFVIPYALVGGNQEWLINIIDVTTSTETYYYIYPNHTSFANAYPAVLEIPNGISNCNLLSNSDVDYFYNTAVYQASGTWPGDTDVTYSGTFGTATGGLSPSCSYSPSTYYGGSNGYYTTELQWAY